MKEALKLFGAMLAIVVSVSALHDLRPAPAVATVDSSVICQRQLCFSSDQCPCGPCVGGQCTTW
jgi:hypothetical protein